MNDHCTKGPASRTLSCPQSRLSSLILLERELVDVIMYVLHNGCVWRALPHEYPPWPTVWTFFRRWRDDGTWQRVHDALHRQVRVA